MKTCKHFEGKLTAYMHGELGENEVKQLEHHLEQCTACRAELDAQRATLELLDETLATAPAPQELSPWRKLQRESDAARKPFWNPWASPRFTSTLAAGALATLFILVSGSVVIFRILPTTHDPVTVDLTPYQEPDRSEVKVAVDKSTMPKPESAALENTYGTEPAADGPDGLFEQAVASYDAGNYDEARILFEAVLHTNPHDRQAMAYLRQVSARTGELEKSKLAGVREARIADVKTGWSAGSEETIAPVSRPQGFSTEGVVSYGRKPEPMAVRGSAGDFNTEQYDWIPDNVFRMAMDEPLSTFSIDVDRAAYANVRRFLNENRLPPPDAVRIEEMINYFEYDYPAPAGEDPFSISMEVADCPWNSEHQLAMIGLQGVEVDASDMPPNNLVFLLDVSGSMNQPNKLPLLKSAMRLLVSQLRPQDRVSIVVYASASGLVLEPTADKGLIEEAIDRLRAGGSTAGGAGIVLAYKTAQAGFIEEGNNRVILATDGDFNVGVSSDGELVRLIEDKRQSGIYLTVLGFGTGNIKDSKMEKLADTGNGNYAYIDDILEARKVLVNEMGGTLLTIAKDVKIQVEFNPAQVKAYRLIGYENRVMANADFNDDRKDAGELGAGHTVTAMYELIPAGSAEVIPDTDELKYQKPQLLDSDELMTVKLRYKPPNSDVSKLLVGSVKPDDYRHHRPSENFRFASEVAEFGLLLRDSQFKGNANYSQIIERARAARGADTEGYRAEFIRLVEKARLLDQTETDR